MPNIKNLFKRRGFTLVELVLSIALVGVLAGVLGVALFQGVKGFDLVSSRKSTLAQARLAMERMVREIRLIQQSSDVVNVSSTTQFNFEYPHGTSIQYALSGGNLMRNTDVLARNVNALAFTYLDGAGVATATAAQVRSVRIQLTLNAPNSHGTLTLRTQIFLRNTGNNYAAFQ